MVKGLGKIPPELREKGDLERDGHLLPGACMGRREQGEANVYQKHRSVRSRKTMYTD